MVKTTEIKFGQDNVDVVNQLLLSGLDYKNVNADGIHQFFLDNVLYTSKSDFRSLTKPFVVVGLDKGVLKQFTINFTRSPYKCLALTENEVAFTALVKDTVLDPNCIKGILDQIGRHNFVAWDASIIVIDRFRAMLNMRHMLKGSNVIKKLRFGFEVDVTDVEVTGSHNGVQPKSSF